VDGKLQVVITDRLSTQTTKNLEFYVPQLARACL
jgi:hypothetical protein